MTSLALLFLGATFEFSMAPSWQALGQSFPQPPLPATSTIGVSITYSIQPPETMKALVGRKLKGLSLLQVIVCNNDPFPTTLSALRVTQHLHERGMSPTSPELVIPTLSNVSKRSPLELAFILSSWATEGAALLTISEAIAASTPWTMGLFLASKGAALARDQLKVREGNWELVRGKLLEGELVMGGGGCVERFGVVKESRVRR